MDWRLAKRILDRLKDVEDRALTRSIGEVTDTSPLTVTIGGVDHTDLKKLSSYTPSVGHIVWVSRSGKDLLVHGEID